MNSFYLRLRNLALMGILLLSMVVFGNEKPIEATNQQKNETDSVYAVVDKYPEFPGGEAARIEFIKQHVQYPDEARKNHEEGRVIVQFVVTRDGGISSAGILKGISQGLDQETLRLVNSFPEWVPGELNGQKVSVVRTMTVTFKYITQESDSLDDNLTDRPLVVIDTLKMSLNFNIDVLNQEIIDTAWVLSADSLDSRRQLIDQYGLSAKKGVVFIRIKKTLRDDIPGSTTGSQDDVNYVWKEVDKMPEYPGGDIKLFSEISNSIRYPINALENRTQGKVVVRFVVDKQGKIKRPVIIKSVDPLLDSEALRVVNDLSDFKPGEKGGVKVNAYFTLPFIFNLESEGLSDIENKKSVIVLDGEKLPDGFNPDWINYGRMSYFDTYHSSSKTESTELIKMYGKEAANGLTVLISKQNYDLPPGDFKKSLRYKLFGQIEKSPEFPGGEKALLDFISANLHYPFEAVRKGIHGRVIIRFVVSETGKVIKTRVVVRVNNQLDQEALRVVGLLPDFIPGENNGKKVAVYYTIPITFLLD